VQVALVQILSSRYNPHSIITHEEIPMFRDEKETMDGLRVKLDELRRYL
jgi:hypothetical protein